MTITAEISSGDEEYPVSKRPRNDNNPFRAPDANAASPNNLTDNLSTMASPLNYTLHTPARMNISNTSTSSLSPLAAHSFSSPSLSMSPYHASPSTLSSTSWSRSQDVPPPGLYPNSRFLQLVERTCMSLQDACTFCWMSQRTGHPHTNEHCPVWVEEGHDHGIKSWMMDATTPSGISGCWGCFRMKVRLFTIQIPYFLMSFAQDAFNDTRGQPKYLGLGHKWNKLLCQQRYVMPLVVFMFSKHPSLRTIFEHSACYCCGVQGLDAKDPKFFAWVFTPCTQEPKIRHCYKLLALAVEKFGPA